MSETIGELDSLPSSGPSAKRPTGMRILLVEDHEDTLAVLSRHLTFCGHHVVVARTAAEAITLAQTTPTDLLLCDFTLPDGDGCDLLGMLSTTRPAICISMSGFGRDRDHQRSLEAGFCHHLTKPFLPDDLDAILAKFPA